MVRIFFIISVALLSLVNSSFSQIKVEEFAISEIKGNTYDNHYFETENGAISVKVKAGVFVSIQNSTPTNLNKNELIIQTYIGDDLRENSSIDYTLPNPNAVFEFVKLYNERFYIFYSVLDKSTSTEQLFAQEINLRTGQPVEEGKLLISVPERLVPNPKYVAPAVNVSVPVHNEQGKFELVESQNKTLIMFKYQFKKQKNDAGAYDRYGVMLFNSDLELVWSNSEFTFPHLSKHLSYADFIVSNDGKGYLLAKKMKDEPILGNKAKTDPDNFSVSLFILSEEQEIKEVDFNLEDRLIKSVAFSDVANGDIICAGYYYAPNKRKFTKGVFTTVFNKKEIFEKVNFYDFTQEFVELYSGASNIKKKSNEKKVEDGKFGLEFLRMNNIQQTKDGGILLIGGVDIPENPMEVGRVSTIMTTGGYMMWNPAGITSLGSAFSWSTKTPNSYFKDEVSGDVILTKLDDKGELMWMQKVPKHTYSPSQLLVSSNYAYAFFLDEPANIQLKESDAPKRLEYTAGVLVAHRISLDSGEKRVFLVANSKDINGNKISYMDRFNLVNKLFPLFTKQGFGCQVKVGKNQEKFFRFIVED